MACAELTGYSTTWIGVHGCVCVECKGSMSNSGELVLGVFVFFFFCNFEVLGVWLDSLGFMVCGFGAKFNSWTVKKSKKRPPKGKNPPPQKHLSTQSQKQNHFNARSQKVIKSKNSTFFVEFENA